MERPTFARENRRTGRIPSPYGAASRDPGSARNDDPFGNKTHRCDHWGGRRGSPGREARLPHGTIGCNRLLARLRHLFNWAIAEGILEQSPFKRGGVTIVKLNMRAEHPRQHRLEPGEEEALLKHAGPHLRALIVAALSTGCRRGELLSLQWSQIRRDEHGGARWIVLPAAKTKTSETRVIPIGPRLRPESRCGSTRRAVQIEHPPTAYVFGDECGEQDRIQQNGLERHVPARADSGVTLS